MIKYQGKNSIIYPLAKIIYPENLSIGMESVIDDFAFIYASGKGIQIGNFCHITAHCSVFAGGKVIFNDFSAIGPGCIVLAESDDYQGNGFIGLKVFGDKYRNRVELDVTFEKHAHVGAGSIIQPGVTIGEGCSIGSGSLVTKSMPPWTICFGSPCKVIKDKPKEKQLQMEKDFLEEYYAENNIC
jgi:galactoside O-acetyltransferase